MHVCVDLCYLLQIFVIVGLGGWVAVILMRHICIDFMIFAQGMMIVADSSCEGINR